MLQTESSFMNLKELVINYSKYEQAYKKNDNIKEILKRYNKFEIYNVIESIFHLFASFAFTFFLQYYFFMFSFKLSFKLLSGNFLSAFLQALS